MSEAPAAAAGVFTTNRVCAAPVHSCRRRVPTANARAIVINSGNANACTGQQGQDDAEAMTQHAANLLACRSEQVLVCSTGVIGRLLPLEKIRTGIDQAFAGLASDPPAFEAAAAGILTTDTRIKTARQTLMVGGGTVQVVGFAKGAAMIGPNLATMLAFILTDAQVSPTLLDRLLRQAVEQSFHCISVEGHQSTNDTVLVLANGASGVHIADDGPAGFAPALEQVCKDLARAIIEDAEGAAHIITIDVTGARTDGDARQVAKTVAESALVKTAVFGNDPNWGRIVSAAGYAGVEFAEKDLSLRVNGTLLYDRGAPTSFDAAAESARLKANRQTEVELLFSLGQGRCRFWTCDLTTEYVHLNADYTT